MTISLLLIEKRVLSPSFLINQDSSDLFID